MSLQRWVWQVNWFPQALSFCLFFFKFSFSCRLLHLPAKLQRWWARLGPVPKSLFWLAWESWEKRHKRTEDFKNIPPRRVNFIFKHILSRGRDQSVHLERDRDLIVSYSSWLKVWILKYTGITWRLFFFIYIYKKSCLCWMVRGFLPTWLLHLCTN